MFLIVAGLCSLAFGLPLGLLMTADKHWQLVRRLVLIDAWAVGLALVSIFIWPVLNHPVPHWHYGALLGALGALIVATWTDLSCRSLHRS